MTLPAGVTDVDVQVAVSSLRIAMDSFEKDVRVDELTPAEHAHLARVVFAALAGRVVVPQEPSDDLLNFLDFVVIGQSEQAWSDILKIAAAADGGAK